MFRIIFLHIPKTAGQTIHFFLVNLFGNQFVCPVRVNEQLFQYSINELEKYVVFSGHFDWCMLDILNGEKFYFSVIRDPLERILSFYFYLRDKAKSLSVQELNLPSNKGLWAALNLSVDEYFCSGPPYLRSFLDNHYDNFYTYYFAGRRYDARSIYKKLLDSKLLSENDIVHIALNNINKSLKIYSIDNIFLLYNELLEIANKYNFNNKIKVEDYLLKKVNKNKNIPESLDARIELLIKLGASEKSLIKLIEYSRLDYLLLRELNVKTHGFDLWNELTKKYG